jgi:hypothetical protein
MQLTAATRGSALLLIGVTHISFDKKKNSFHPLEEIKSSFELLALRISESTSTSI